MAVSSMFVSRASSLMLGILMLLGLASGIRAEEETQSKDCGWCVITTPKVVSTAVPFKVTFEMKGITEPVKLSADVHWLKKDGSWGGFLAWGGYPVTVEKDGPVVKTLTITDVKDDLGSVQVKCFISPDGNYQFATKQGEGPAMELKMTEAFMKSVRPKDCTFKKSWICFAPLDRQRAFKAGEAFEVKVNYYLDPSENWGEGTTLSVMSLGPWIDNPDGVYTKERHHIPYPGMGIGTARVAPGLGEQVFTFKADSVYRYNDVLLIAKFKGGDNREWPWEMRSRGPRYVYEDKNFQLQTSNPGGLFTYDEPVKVQIAFRAGAVKGDTKTLKYSIYNTKGIEIGSGTKEFTVGEERATAEFTPTITERGTFVLEGSVDGWGTRDVIFARIPDVLAITKNGMTQFGGTNLQSEAECRIARMLGLTTARHFVEWRSVQPGRDTWNFEVVDKILETNKRYGIKPWLCLATPPNWVMTCAAADVGYEPFPFIDADVRNSVEIMTRRWKDSITGWEWLNEIVPGNKSADPVADYARFCAVSTAAAKGIEPKLRTSLAGGLWPRSFRNDLLRAGVAKSVDELPVHYGDMGAILDARDDLEAVGATALVVSDNETSRGLGTWNMPSRDMIKMTGQSQWALDQWPDELVAGANHITVFAGWANPCGDFGYILDEHTPRPYAATIAVLTSKLAGAKPVGKFFLPEHGVFHLFERDGKAVLIASSSAQSGEPVTLAVGSERVVITDNQGNETPMNAPGGHLHLQLAPMRVFIEGGSLKVLASYCSVNIGDGKRIVALPKMSVLKGSATKVPVSIDNSYPNELDGTVSISAPAGWPQSHPLSFSVKPGRHELLDAPIAIPASVMAGEFVLKAVFTFKDARIPPVTKNFCVAVITREMVGNMLKNGGFEQPGKDETAPAEWGMSGKTSSRQPSGGGLGLGSSVLRFEKAAGYENVSQRLSPPAGQTYLYSAWVWNDDMMAGSNITHRMADGKSRDFYVPDVFMSAAKSSSWHLYTCKTDTPVNLQSIDFTPVVKGQGWAMYDNMRVSIYEGSSYTAEAHRAKSPIRFDGTSDAGGSLAGWNTNCPIPLLCANQIVAFDKAYKWTPENLSGVAHMMWDDKSLYLRVEVIDDVHVANTTGEETLAGDSLAVAIHPYNRAPGKDEKAFVYYISSASPGGGSGACTVYRPSVHSGGLSSGQLAKDSSVYDVSVKTAGKRTVYLVRMPWSELGGINPAFGSKFGMSLMLNDNDGAGKAAAMVWGDGLSGGWSPSNFGITTLVDE